MITIDDSIVVRAYLQTTLKSHQYQSNANAALKFHNRSPERYPGAIFHI
jgi:hypothetical protein